MILRVVNILTVTPYNPTAFFPGGLTLHFMRHTFQDMGPLSSGLILYAHVYIYIYVFEYIKYVYIV